MTRPTQPEATQDHLPRYRIVPAPVMEMPFAPASVTQPVVCMICGCLVEGTRAGMDGHKRWHDILTAGGLGA